MLQKLGDFLCSLMPTEGEVVLMSIGAGIGAAATFAFGTIDDAIMWLLAFIAIDYMTGTAAAFKSGEWSSNTGFVGILKKFVIVSVVAMCHGLDAVCGTEIMRNAAVFAYCLNEFGSVVENLERLNMGKVIPPVIRRGLLQLKKKEEEIFHD